jgi:hypothetical protein
MGEATLDRQLSPNIVDDSIEDMSLNDKEHGYNNIKI